MSSPSLETLKKVQIDPQSSSFSLLIDKIAVSVDVYDMLPDDEDYEDDDFPKIELKNAVLNQYAIFLKSDSAIDVEIELDSLLIEDSSIVKYECKDSNIL